MSASPLRCSICRGRFLLSVCVSLVSFHRLAARGGPGRSRGCGNGDGGGGGGGGAFTSSSRLKGFHSCASLQVPPMTRRGDETFCSAAKRRSDGYYEEWQSDKDDEEQPGTRYKGPRGVRAWHRLKAEKIIGSGSEKLEMAWKGSSVGSRSLKYRKEYSEWEDKLGDGTLPEAEETYSGRSLKAKPAIGKTMVQNENSAANFRLGSKDLKVAKEDSEMEDELESNGWQEDSEWEEQEDDILQEFYWEGGLQSNGEILRTEGKAIVNSYESEDADSDSDDGSLYSRKRSSISMKREIITEDNRPDLAVKWKKVAAANANPCTCTDLIASQWSECRWSQVKQKCIVAPTRNHFALLYHVLKDHMNRNPDYKVLIFCTSASVTALLSELFKKLGFNARAIPSQKAQEYRTRISDEFRMSNGAILLFTSHVSARGVDYPNITLIIQVGIPSKREHYINRLGRTGHVGKDREGLLLLAPWEGSFLAQLEDLPIEHVTTPELNQEIRSLIRSKASIMNTALRSATYSAWLRYYKSLKNLSLSREEILYYAKEFSFSIGFDVPPHLSRALLVKMGLEKSQGRKRNSRRR